MGLKITCTIEAATAMCISSTAVAVGIGLDRMTTRRIINGHAEELVIPATTIKGKTRYECERLLRSSRVRVCSPPRPESMCPNPHDEYECPICILFGRPGRKGGIRFSDARVQNPKALLNDYVFRTGVSLSRQRRSAEEGKLYFAEMAAADLSFKAMIQGELQPVGGVSEQAQAGLIVAGLKSIIALGNSKSRGSGWTRLKDLEVAIGEKPVEVSALMSAFVEEVAQWSE